MNIDEKNRIDTSLLALFSLREPVILSAIKALQLQKGRTSLDAGCGAGFATLLLAREVGSSGQITGLDIDSSVVKTATSIARQLMWFSESGHEVKHL